MNRSSPNNEDLFESTDRVATYAAKHELTDAEQHLIDRWVRQESSILDLGVGTGRTTEVLRRKASTYVGLDYSHAMVTTARANFPQETFVVGDAADLGRFDDETFDAVVFSFNGLDYLQPENRRSTALAEIRRVLRPDGVFIMSTHNPRAVVRPPGGEGPRARRLAAAGLMTVRAIQARGFSDVVRRGHGYHRDHVQGLDTYFATPDRLADELKEAGFTLLERVGSDFPAKLRAWSSSWTYVAATPTPQSVVVARESFPHSDSDPLSVAWDSLASRVADGPFQTRAWVSAWRRHLEPTASIGLITARDPQGELMGLLPFAHLSRRIHRRVRVPLKYVGLAGSGPGAADHLGPVAASSGVGAILLQTLASDTEDSILLESLAPRWAPVAQAATGAVALTTTTCMVSERSQAGSFADVWSAKARKNARRRERLLVAEGITSRWVPPGPEFDAALRELRGLHDSRWNAKGQAGLFATEREALLKAYASGSTPEEGPWILVLETPQGAVAALLGIRFRRSFSVYKTGWDPALSRLGLGMALGQEAMRWSEEMGLTTFDYLRGARSHKVELGCRPVEDSTLIRPSLVSGQLLALREGAPAVVTLAKRSAARVVARAQGNGRA